MSLVGGVAHRSSFRLLSSAASEDGERGGTKKAKLRLLELGKSRLPLEGERLPLTISDIKKSRKAKEATSGALVGSSTTVSSSDKVPLSSTSGKAIDDGRFVSYQFASSDELQKKKMDDRLKVRTLY